MTAPPKSDQKTPKAPALKDPVPEKPIETSASKEPVQKQPVETSAQQKVHARVHIALQIHFTDTVLQKPSTSKPQVTRKLAPNEDTHGTSDKLNSFLKCHMSEPKCAAYLGFTDLGEFRKFEFSYIVLEVFNIWSKHCDGKSSVVPLELIRDLQNPDENFPEDLAVAVEKYGRHAELKNPTATAAYQLVERDNNANYLKATLIYRLTSRIEQGLPSVDGDSVKARQADAAKGFAALTKRSIPGFDCTTITMPKLGPHIDLGEAQLERYNRALNLIRSIAVTASGTRWAEKMATSDSYCAITLHPSSLPRWMIYSAKQGRPIAAAEVKKDRRGRKGKAGRGEMDSDGGKRKDFQAQSSPRKRRIKRT